MQILPLRLIKFTAAVAIVASVFAPGTPLPVPIAHAQVSCSTAGADPATCIPSGESTAAPAAQATNPATNSNGNVTTGTQYNFNGSKVTPGDNSGTGTDLECSTSNISLCISGFVYWITVGIGSWAANIAAYVFDYAVMLSLQSGAYALDVIAVGWGIVRDVANMSFLFILVYIAFKIMFQAETTGTTRMLVWVVIVALLVNFSFVMTRAVIDAGNIVALQFYNAIASVSPTINDGQQTSGGIPVKDITASIMTALNPQDIIGNGGQFKNFIASQSNSTMYYLIVSSVVYILMGVSLFMVAAVFIFAAVRFVTRVIGLAGLIMIAPAAFVAAIFRGKEGGAKWFNMWLGYLLEFTFYPAVFLFLFYIEVRFMQDMGNARLFNGAFNAAGTGSQSWTMMAQGLANVGVRLAYIIASLYLILRASQWSSQAFNKVGAGWISGKINSLNLNPLRLAGKGYARAGGLAYQQLVGRGAAAAANGMERRGLGSSFLGYRAKQGLNALAGTKLGGSRSFNQFKDTRDKELEERGKIRDRAERREAVQGLYTAADTEKTSAQGAATAQRAQGQAAVNSLYRAAQREANQPNDITAAKSVAIPTGTRRLPGGAQINQVQGGPTGLPASTPFNVSAQRALDEIKQKAQQVARSGSVAINLVAATPNMTASASARPPIAEPQKISVDSSAVREEIKGLGQSVRDAVAAAKNGAAMPTKVVIQTPTSVTNTTIMHQGSGDVHLNSDDVNKIAKKLAHKLEPIVASHTEPTPPSPAAPAAARPQNPENDNNPPPNPGMGGMQPLPKAA